VSYSKGDSLEQSNLQQSSSVETLIQMRLLKSYLQLSLTIYPLPPRHYWYPKTL
jgi:hypothetical protein